MTTPQPIGEDISQSLFKNDVLLYMLGFLALALIEIFPAVRLEKYYAAWLPSAPQHIAWAFFIAFVIGLGVSAVLGIWTTRAVGDAITWQVRAEGSLISRQGSLFRDFGIVLGVTVWVVISVALSYVCNPVIPVNESAGAAGRLLCYFIGKGTLVFTAGLMSGLLTWLYFWVIRYEKLTRSEIFVTRYASKKWSVAGFVGIATVVIIVIFIVFYRLFTLQ